MGEIVHFRRPQPVQPLEDFDEFDEHLLRTAYNAAHAAAEQYERERRRERDLMIRIDALMRENAKLRAKLRKQGR
jgi:hypothetical protein